MNSINLRVRPLHLSVPLLATAGYSITNPAVARTLAFKLQNYAEEDGRIKVDSAYALWDETIGEEWEVAGELVYNTISGATPTGMLPEDGSDQVPLDELDDERSAIIVNLNRSLGDWQLRLNLAYSRNAGYLNDPYKLIQQDLEIFPGFTLPIAYKENRPDERERWILSGQLNRRFEPLSGTIEAGYRFTRDDWGVNTHTMSLIWFQDLGSRVILQPSIRYLRQSAADFDRDGRDNLMEFVLLSDPFEVDPRNPFTASIAGATNDRHLRLEIVRNPELVETQMIFELLTDPANNTWTAVPNADILIEDGIWAVRLPLAAETSSIFRARAVEQ